MVNKITEVSMCASCISLAATLIPLATSWRNNATPCPRNCDAWRSASAEILIALPSASAALVLVISNACPSFSAAAFKFVDERNLMQALIRTVEGSIRAFVATKRQAEVLVLRRDIVEHVKEQLDVILENWGYHLQDLQLNDITFDEIIMKSMSQVVASNNLKAAAENEGQALLITKTKAAEAEGNAIKISAEAERQASQLRGQGVALFREEVAKGMSVAAKEMQDANMDTSVILFTMWTESIKHFAENSQGNVIFLDGSTDAMQQTMKEMMSLNLLHNQQSKGKSDK